MAIADVGLAVEQHLRDLLRRALVQVAACTSGSARGSRAPRPAARSAPASASPRSSAGRGPGCAKSSPARFRLSASSSSRSTIGSTASPGGGQPGQALAGAHEDLDAELVLELADLAADARLRGVQRLRDLGQVEAVANGFAHRAQLLEVHARNANRIGAELLSRSLAAKDAEAQGRLPIDARKGVWRAWRMRHADLHTGPDREPAPASRGTRACTAGQRAAAAIRPPRRRPRWPRPHLRRACTSACTRASCARACACTCARASASRSGTDRTDGRDHRAGPPRQRSRRAAVDHRHRERQRRRHARRVRGRRVAGGVGQQRAVSGGHRHRQLRGRATRRAGTRPGRGGQHLGMDHRDGAVRRRQHGAERLHEDRKLHHRAHRRDRDGAGFRRQAVHRRAGRYAARLQGRVNCWCCRS